MHALKAVCAVGNQLDLKKKNQPFCGNGKAQEIKLIIARLVWQNTIEVLNDSSKPTNQKVSCT
jgi:hypothetical protein